MNGPVFAALLGLLLGASPAFGQAGQAPARPPARPVPPAQPAAPPPAQPALQPPAPFPQGARVAYVNVQAIAQLSADGKAAAARVQALQQKKQKEGEDKAKALQANQQKLQTSGSVMSEAARAQLEKEIERQQRDGERFEQDAQTELNELQQELQQDFQKKLMPVLQQIAKEKGLHALFSAADAGLIWAEAGLDLTLDAVKRLDGAKAGAAAPAAAAPPAAAPPAGAAPAPPPAAPAPAAPAPPPPGAAPGAGAQRKP
jgi:Skp family chaperone for outer membrane proteins